MEIMTVPIRDKILIDIDEFKEITGIGDSKARELISRDDFPKIRIGNRNKVILAELNEYFNERRGEYL